MIRVLASKPNEPFRYEFNVSGHWVSCNYKMAAMLVGIASRVAKTSYQRTKG
ncbi:hypothetical protein [Celerinatantimonas sp. MCCC 1A17872]|uniref:hypothetical protein n=1 Tax=Celerinatantimonas sp. MCCC 1A17872 TaxID=3177514 RepID=UPI0038BFA8DB